MFVGDNILVYKHIIRNLILNSEVTEPTFKKCLRSIKSDLSE